MGTSLTQAIDAKVRRLRIFMLTVAVAAVGLMLASTKPWYTAQYTLDTYAGVPVEVRPSVQIDAWEMVAISRSVVQQAPSAVSNPQVSSIAGLPVFIAAPLVAALVALVGLWLRSAAITLLSMIGYGYGWFHVARVRWWFEQAPGRDGWVIERGVGHNVFLVCITVSCASIVAAAIHAARVYRMERTARIAAGEVVEETAIEMFSKLITRSTTPTPMSPSSSPNIKQ